MRPLWIFDIDGTLSDPDHRRHLVECDRAEQQWDVFYELCDKDGVNEPVMQVLEALHVHDAEIWFFTGRPESVRGKTLEWLWNYTPLDAAQLENGQVVMRANGDYRPDNVIKQEMLDRMLPEDRARLVGVFDDRRRIVDMWRKNGIMCFHVKDGDF